LALNMRRSRTECPSHLSVSESNCVAGTGCCCKSFLVNTPRLSWSQWRRLTTASFRLQYILAIGTIVALAVSAWGEQTNVPLRLAVDLVDGSHIVGIPAITSFPVQTTYAKMTIPINQVTSIALADDHENAAFELTNGDKVRGVLTLGPLKLTTVFGGIAVGTEHIKRLRVWPTGGALPEALRRGLVLYYSFDRDEGDRVTDRSMKENNGVVRGPPFTPDGRFGGALVFDGADDFLEAGNPPSLQLTTNFTLAAWIWPERTPDSFGIITKRQGSPEQDRRGIEFMLGHDDTLSAYFWDDSTRYFSGVVKNKTIRRQEWTHVVLLHDSTLPEHQMRAFINGVPCEMNYGYETISSIPVVRNVAEPVRIGCMRPGVHHFKGRIDEAMVFNRALSKDEVKMLYDDRDRE
jgi:hypothetical protein